MGFLNEVSFFQLKKKKSGHTHIYIHKHTHRETRSQEMLRESQEILCLFSALVVSE